MWILSVARRVICYCSNPPAIQWFNLYLFVAGILISSLEGRIKFTINFLATVQSYHCPLRFPDSAPSETFNSIFLSLLSSTKSAFNLHDNDWRDTSIFRRAVSSLLCVIFLCICYYFHWPACLFQAVSFPFIVSPFFEMASLRAVIYFLLMCFPIGS